jgi:hypothetical protein
LPSLSLALSGFLHPAALFATSTLHDNCLSIQEPVHFFRWWNFYCRRFTSVCIVDSIEPWLWPVTWIKGWNSTLTHHFCQWLGSVEKVKECSLGRHKRKHCGNPFWLMVSKYCSGPGRVVASQQSAASIYCHSTNCEVVVIDS